MLKRNSQGQVIRVFTYSSPMRKHGGDRAQFNAFAALDAIAHAPRSEYRGVILRKRAAK
jgi:hypothetical protein